VTTVVGSMLPQEFSDLEPFAAAWSLPTEPERFAQRLRSSMAEIQPFYDAMIARADDAMTYCDKFPLDELPADAKNLLYLLFSWVLISFPVECWGQASVPDTGAAYLDLLVAPGP
jgi:hypothetical protein